ncbi:MAG: DNA-binding protein [Sulfurimonadaceae bacterium]|nr:DNA-binding protein [Sulfurimonadaceae bacterium]
MKKLTIQEAADELGVSKEAIHNRIRRGSLKVTMQNGTKYVSLEQKEQKLQDEGDRYYKFLESQNQKLQDKLERFESEIRELRDQKERLLVEEKLKIEQVYRQKDEHLKSIVEAISSKLILPPQDHIEVEPLELQTKLISLKKYLKSYNLSSRKTDKILKKFTSINDVRVVKLGKKIYIDPQKYDYSDLLGVLE